MTTPNNAEAPGTPELYFTKNEHAWVVVKIIEDAMRILGIAKTAERANEYAERWCNSYFKQYYSHISKKDGCFKSYCHAQHAMVVVQRHAYL